MSTDDTVGELAVLRAEFPCHQIEAEPIVDWVRYVARSRQEGVRPHTVITRDLGELRTALEAGRAGGSGQVGG